MWVQEVLISRFKHNLQLSASSRIASKRVFLLKMRCFISKIDNTVKPVLSGQNKGLKDKW